MQLCVKGCGILLGILIYSLFSVYAQPSCQTVAPNKTLCRIEQPTVSQRLTEYPNIRFQSGDRVRVSAGGCVQTGGSGRTWKRYVNPSGRNSDRLYHGLIEIPGATQGLERIENVLNRELVISASTNISQLFLRLGYEDDDFSDNGYWGHDNGTEDQCKGVGNAFVELSIERIPQAVAPPAPTPVACLSSNTMDQSDSDRDGIVDSCEQALAEKYAPIIIHASDEPNLPANVDWFLSKTTLWFYDDNCTPDLKQRLKIAPKQSELLTFQHSGDCGSRDTIFSNGTRSIKKQRTFFLEDVADEFRKGSVDSRDWVTYYHTYLNDIGGLTIQYWRFYAYNTGKEVGSIEFGFHGGDWEGIHVVLNQDLQPAEVRLLGHTDIKSVQKPSWGGLQWEGTHAIIFSEKGGHASEIAGNENGIRQNTWSSGKVWWPSGKETTTGELVNVGEKSFPMKNQMFIQYSGIWGSPGTFFFSSGYWGPAFNETTMGNDGFVTAWCAGMKSQTREECYPAATSR